VVGTVPNRTIPPMPTMRAGAAQQARIERFRRDPGRADPHRRGRRAPHRPEGRGGARCGDERQVFTSLSVPVMTRLRMPERQCSTRSSAPASRSRSGALGWACAWCATTRASGSSNSGRWSRCAGAAGRRRRRSASPPTSRRTPPQGSCVGSAPWSVPK
jgi:hypothetical protein